MIKTLFLRDLRECKYSEAERNIMLNFNMFAVKGQYRYVMVGELETNMPNKSVTMMIVMTECFMTV